jgi:hypothetical protein
MLYNLNQQEDDDSNGFWVWECLESGFIYKNMLLYGSEWFVEIFKTVV